MVYERRLMNADGSTSSVAEIVEEMLDAGVARRLVDAWLFGLDRGRDGAVGDDHKCAMPACQRRVATAHMMCPRCERLDVPDHVVADARFTRDNQIDDRSE